MAAWHWFLMLSAAGAMQPATAATRMPENPAVLPVSLDGNDLQTVVSILQDAGYRARIKISDDGTRYIDSAANGVSFTISFTDCAQGRACKGIRFFAWWTRPPSMDSVAVNEWNGGYRIARAAIDRDDDLVLDYFMSLVGGVATANFLDSFDWWTVLVGDFRDFMAEKQTNAAATVSVPVKGEDNKGMSSADEKSRADRQPMDVPSAMRYCRANSCGERPVRRRKAVEKLLGLAKPRR